MTLVAGMIVCDFKRYQLEKTLYRLSELTNIDAVYLNIETKNPALYKDLIEAWPQTKPLHFDFWNTSGNWRPERKYDQHQIRLLSICTARNMCIDYAMISQAKHLLFVDSDVLVDYGAVGHLIGLNKNLCGGLVPGRGEYDNVYYVFGGQDGWEKDEVQVVECRHGTCGFMLISRFTFSRLRFRWGAHPDIPTEMLSEDPAYCIDWHKMTGERFYVNKLATAHHIDNDEIPLTLDEGVHIEKDWWSDMYTNTEKGV